MIKLAAGRFKADPFEPGHYEELRDVVKQVFGLPADVCGVAERQCMRLGMISGVLKALGDPD